jgi:hypothetical protein
MDWLQIIEMASDYVKPTMVSSGQLFVVRGPLLKSVKSFKSLKPLKSLKALDCPSPEFLLLTLYSMPCALCSLDNGRLTTGNGQ